MPSSLGYDVDGLTVVEQDGQVARPDPMELDLEPELLGVTSEGPRDGMAVSELGQVAQIVAREQQSIVRELNEAQVHVRAVWYSRDQPLYLVTVAPQTLGQVDIDSDRAPATGCFRLFEVPSMLDGFFDGPADRQGPGIEIDIRPAQCDDLVPSRPRPCGNVD